MCNFRRRLSVIPIGILMALFIAACGPSSQPGQPAKEEGKASQAQTGPAKYGGTFVTANSSVAPSFDLISEGTGGTWLPTIPLYNGLLQYDVIDHEGMPTKIIPDLAERWDVSSDGLAYTFHLRKGVKFHDGAEFTSADAKFSLERIMEPPPKTPSLRQGWYKGFITRMETPDKHTLVVHLNQQYAAFIKLIATPVTPMVPKHLLEPYNTRITDIKLLVGTGPFKMAEGDRTTGYKLAKNQEYYRQDRPFLDGIDIQVIIDDNLRIAAIKTGRVDSLLDSGAPEPLLKSVKSEMGDRIVVTPILSLNGSRFWFNHKKKPFDDARVRKAIALAFDNPAITKIAFDGAGCGGGYYAPIGEWGRPCDYWWKQAGFRTPTPEDLTEAKRLLAEAGYPDGFDTTLNNGYSAGNDRAHELLTPMLEKIGIKAKVRQLERTAYYAAMDNGDFEMTSIGLGLSVDDPNDFVGTQYITGAGRNYGGFSDSVVDRLYQEQSKTMDPNERKKLARQIEDRLVELRPMIPMSWSQKTDVYASYVKGHKTVAGRFQDHRREHIWLDK